MNRETISSIELLDTGELLLALQGQGHPDYQFVYRGAAGVYWDQARHGFKSTPLKKWSCSTWFLQIVCVVRQELGVELHLCKNSTWRNISAQDRAAIERGDAI
jgi:hypothetical protein